MGASTRSNSATPTYASWANPIEAQFGSLRTFLMRASDHPDHTVLAASCQAYLRWRNDKARHAVVGGGAWGGLGRSSGVRPMLVSTD